MDSISLYMMWLDSCQSCCEVWNCFFVCVSECNNPARHLWLSTYDVYMLLKSLLVDDQLSTEVKSICASCRWHHTRMTPGQSGTENSPLKAIRNPKPHAQTQDVMSTQMHSKSAVKGGLGWNNATCSPSDWSVRSRFVVTLRSYFYLIAYIWWAFVSHLLKLIIQSIKHHLHLWYFQLLAIWHSHCLHSAMPHIHNGPINSQVGHLTSLFCWMVKILLMVTKQLTEKALWLLGKKNRMFPQQFFNDDKRKQEYREKAMQY